MDVRILKAILGEAGAREYVENFARLEARYGPPLPGHMRAEIARRSGSQAKDGTALKVVPRQPSHDAFFADMLVPGNPAAAKKALSAHHPFWHDMLPSPRLKLNASDVEKVQALSRQANQAEISDYALLQLIETFGIAKTEQMLNIITEG